MSNALTLKPLSFSPATLIAWLARLTATAMFSQMIISMPLWLSSTRAFPKVPLFEWLPIVYPAVLGFVLFAATMISLLGVMLLPIRFFRWFLMGLLVFLPLLVLEDAMRLQPWVYQDYLLFGLFLIFFTQKTDAKAAANHLQPLRWAMVFTYGWSGAHKINVHFRENVFEWLTGILPFTKPYGASDTLAFGLGVTEILFALGLLLPFVWPRRAVLVGVTVMHIVILSLLIRDDWNEVVWPWNGQMILMAWLLFFPKKSNVRFPVRMPGQWAVTLLMGVLPALYLFEKMDAALSLSMYSGTAVESVWYWESDDVTWKCLPKEAQTHVRVTKKIYLDDWSMVAIKVPLYANPGVYRRVTRAFCACELDRESRGLEIIWYPRWSEKRSERVSCAEIMAE